MAKEYVNKSGYTSKKVEACNSVLLELAHILGEFRGSMVLVGGGVPPFLLPHAAGKYVGTVDIDLALDIDEQPEATYARFREALVRYGYEEGRQPYIFYRDVPVGDGSSIRVEVDFLAAEYGGTGRGHRHQRFDDARPRKARGCDLAFSGYIEVNIEGSLPEGGKDAQKIKVISLAPFLVMKAIALNDRLKPKDAWDVYFVISNHEGGIEAVAAEFKPLLDNGLVQEALENLRKAFESVEHVGPKMVSDFEEIEDREEVARLRRDAFEKVNGLLAAIEEIYPASNP